ncbi:MAG TPA: hypothetical protein VNQ90_01655 [Chthoniobacteraceae bacterium]|nr:hypothetical protein [Chthoniobacteraceae bacterium]
MKPRPRRSKKEEQRRLRVETPSLFADDPAFGDGLDASDAFYPDARPEKEPLVVPQRWVNAAIALFLLPPAWIWTQTFFTLFSHQTVHHAFWATEELWFFSLGTLLWLIAFFGLPRPVTLYVFGHELTHAIWSWLMGGRVSEFKFSEKGGYILTNKHNFWISLAPYFYPVYSVAVIILYGIASLFWDVAPHTRWLFLALGVTWAFHISFTVWMIPKGQSDLTHHGTFFSLVIIYLMNLALLSALVILTAPNATFVDFCREFYRNTSHFTGQVMELLRALR